MVEPDKNKREPRNGEVNGASVADGEVEIDEASPGGDGAMAEVASDGRLRDLEAAMAASESRVLESQQQLLRLRADFDNQRRRAQKEREEYLHFAGEKLVMALLPVLDDFERALKSPGEHLSDFLAGVQMIHRRLCETLTAEGLAVIPVAGAEFDPNCHEAVGFETAEDQAPNSVVEEYRRGYTFRGKVLRPAMVKVAKLPK